MTDTAEERLDIVERLEEEADRFDFGAHMDRDEHPLLLAEAAECIRRLRAGEAAAREEERHKVSHAWAAALATHFGLSQAQRKVLHAETDKQLRALAEKEKEK